MQKISVVVPVYNNRPSLEETCRQILEVHSQSFADLELELIFVNDGSTDNSWEELLRLQELHKREVSLINLTRNFGQLGALFAGFNHATGDAVICVSADLQDPIGLMGKMVAYWRNNTDIVICYRENRKDGLINRTLSNLAYFIARSSYPELPRGGTDYWLMSRRVCKLLCSFKGRHFSANGYLLSVGFNKAFIPYTRARREFGRSGYTFWKKLKIVVDFVVDSSYLPVRFMSAFGILVSLSGLIYSILIVNAWFMSDTPFSGWAPLMILTLVIGGMIMIMLGVIGEYVWRIYDNVRDLPLFIVADTSAGTGGKDDHGGAVRD